VAGTVVVVTAVVVVAAAVVVVAVLATVIDEVESFPSLDELQPAATSTKAMDAPKSNRTFTRTLPEFG